MIHPHEHEILKASIHGALGALVGVCAVYNTACWLKRPSGARHNLINALVYAALAGWEVAHVKHHVGQRGPA